MKNFLFRTAVVITVVMVYWITNLLWKKFRHSSEEEKEMIRICKDIENPFAVNKPSKKPNPSNYEQINVSQSQSSYTSNVIPWCRDIMVFDISRAPKTKEDFYTWRDKQIAWAQENDYTDENITGQSLRDWYLEITKIYPPMNGSLSPTEEELEKDEMLEIRMTDYLIGENIIYASFANSVCEDAYALALALAIKHGLGLYGFDLEDKDIVLPDGSYME